jgi:hypothetical protein
LVDEGANGDGFPTTQAISPLEDVPSAMLAFSKCSLLVALTFPHTDAADELTLSPEVNLDTNESCVTEDSFFKLGRSTGLGGATSEDCNLGRVDPNTCNPPFAPELALPNSQTSSIISHLNALIADVQLTWMVLAFFQKGLV